MLRQTKRVVISVTFLLAVSTIGCPAVRPRTIIYDQGNVGVVGVESVGYSGSHQAADGFSLAVGLSTISRVEWWGRGMPGDTTPNELVIRIFEDDGSGKPSRHPLYAIPVGPANRRATGGVTDYDQPIYSYAANITPITLRAGIQYYLSIVDESPPAWGWMESSDIPGHGRRYSRYGDGTPWTAADRIDYAFRLRQ